ncbi:hypothetical protein LOTGIDRAFT_230260 [Lottia gigantea]|uniref:dolichyl-phosphate-mannose--protein mannosyltransferase n=1 Tax=Lottia gigantea TaxID=225164 RepID=V4CNL0_LOTGI|nr:hypothetical protein LOTGIDRAFT_230260 [Lottia gigantea]ESP03985.1 hypothetical protein LOTGIDRAFT_230260 [Lottia gigantea]
MEVNNNIAKSPNLNKKHEKSSVIKWGSVTLYTLPVILGILCYINSMNGDFVHDDIFAIKNNPDVTGKSPISELWKNDFWGKFIQDRTSHKSYRPITTLSFRLNYALSDGKPFTFHIINVALHCLVTALFIYILRQIFHISNSCTFYSAVIFAVHPIHTEAVSGIVGRADILAAVFFLLSIIFYIRSIEVIHPDEDVFIPSTINWCYFTLSISLAIISTLCKEHGVMVLVVSAAIDCLILSRNGVNRWISREVSIIQCKPLIIRVTLLAFSFISIFLIRCFINGWQVPIFLDQDNPASFSSSLLTRILTYNYLLVFNIWLLISPITLCYDWQLGSIPLVQDISDSRNLATLVFYIAFISIIIKSLKIFRNKGCSKNIPVLSLIFLTIPFIPASNFFIRVGFVVAERILYIPSLGFSLMVGYGLTKLCSRYSKKKWLLITIFTVYTLLLAAKTLHRNQVWQSRQSLFWSGVVTLPHNAKVHYNYGNYLKDNNEIHQAIQHYTQAIRLYPEYSSVHNNLGTILSNQTQSEYHFNQALKHNPQHKGALVNLGNIYHSQKKEHQAESKFKQALKIDPNYSDAILSFIKLLMETNRNDEAKKYLETAMKTEPFSHNVHSYHGAYHLASGKYNLAVKSFLTAYSLDNRAISSLINAASTLRSQGHVGEAEDLLKRAWSMNPTDDLKNQLGLLYFYTNHVPESLNTFETILRKTPNNMEAATNYARVLFAQERLDEAAQVVENVLSQGSQNIDALQLIGNICAKKGDKRKAIEYLEIALHQTSHQIPDKQDLYLTLLFNIGTLHQQLNEYQSALQYFNKILDIEPNYPQAYLHIGGILHIQNDFKEARRYYNKVLKLEPQNEFALQNLVKLSRLERKQQQKQKL